MENAQTHLQPTQEEAEGVSALTVHPHELHVGPPFYEDFALRGIQLDRVEPGLVSCTFKVPPRLIDRSGNLAPGAIATLVDVVGNALVYKAKHRMNVSVDMSISYLAGAKVDDELEVTSRLLGQRGLVSGTSIIIKKKASGEVVAEGRHSLFSRPTSKI